MPQIWMTYDELAGLLACGLPEVQDRIRRAGLDRRHSRDGHTRVKLNFPMIALFVARIRGEAVPLDRAIETMRVIHGTMQSYEEDHVPGRRTRGFPDATTGLGGLKSAV